MRISIALCTYNGEKYLASQLESFVAQTRLPDEMIVCDDQSTDHTLNILNDFASKAPFPVHVYINEQRLKSTKNFERAIGLCSGDVIAPSDQDDVWLPAKLARMEAEFAVDERVALVFSDAFVVDEQLQSKHYRLSQSLKFTPRLRNRLERGDAFGVLLKQNFVSGMTMAFRARYVPVALPISSLWVHDGWIALTLSLYGQIRFIEEPLILYRQHANNQIGTSMRSLAGWVMYSLQAGSQGLFHALENYKAFKAHALELNDIPGKDEVIRLLSEKIAHLDVRANLPGNRLRRILPIFHEFVTQRYRHYSSGGMFAIARDILR